MPEPWVTPSQVRTTMSMLRHHGNRTLYLPQTRRNLLSVLWNEDVSHTVPQLFSLRLFLTQQTATVPVTATWMNGCPITLHTDGFPLLLLQRGSQHLMPWMPSANSVTECFPQAGKDDMVTKNWAFKVWQIWLKFRVCHMWECISSSAAASLRVNWNRPHFTRLLQRLSSSVFKCLAHRSGGGSTEDVNSPKRWRCPR